MCFREAQYTKKYALIIFLEVNKNDKIINVIFKKCIKKHFEFEISVVNRIDLSKSPT